MFLDLDFAERNQFINSEFCIVGAGPAGISAAIELERLGHDVVICEGGGENFESESQDIYRGTVIGDPYPPLDVSRLRYLGGSSNHWEGACRYLDEFDFQTKKAYPKAYWPINKSDLDPYLSAACRILDVRSFESDVSFEKSLQLKEIDFVFTNPVRFKDKFGPSLKTFKKINLISHANLIKLSMADKRVISAKFEAFSGKLLEVKAKYFIFAMGGIENSRMLLYFNKLLGSNLVPSISPLGRYWLEHPHAVVGEILFRSSEKRTRYLSLTSETQLRLSILNQVIRLHPIPEEGAKKLIGDLMCISPKAGKWAMNLFKRDLLCAQTLYAVWEQEPLFDNRVSLSTSAFDRFGIPRPQIFWKRSSQDLKTIRDSLSLISDHFLNTNQGRVRLNDWVINNYFPDSGISAGPHQMGGTRMAETPTDGVVDKNCKVFDVKNLFIAGSSVFPSAGHANPTLTVVQLALRLANYLNKITIS